MYLLSSNRWLHNKKLSDIQNRFLAAQYFDKNQVSYLDRICLNTQKIVVKRKRKIYELIGRRFLTNLLKNVININDHTNLHMNRKIFKLASIIKT